MKPRVEKTLIYHITDVENLPGIVADGRIWSDAVMNQRNPTIIGYNHIKERRLKEIRVACCEDRFVGEFVPFYFCPRSPMLFTTNRGNTGRPPGCQRTIVHLVSSIDVVVGVGQPWAVADGNAGAFHTSFSSSIDAIRALDWEAIRATDWRGKTHEKSAECLVLESFPWEGVQAIGCYNAAISLRVQDLLKTAKHRPPVSVERSWYY
jgi:hypothetical protein